MADIVSQLRSPAIPRYAPIPLDIIGNAIKSLDAKQEKGLLEYDALQEMKRAFLSNQIPSESRQNLVGGIVDEIDTSIKSYVNSGDFINSRQAIRSAANKLQDRLSPFVQDNQRYQAALASIAKIREKGDAFTASDQYYAVQESLNTIEENEGKGRFTAGSIGPRFDSNKFLSDFASQFDPEGRISRSADGRYNIKTDTIDEQEVLQASRQALLGQSGFTEGLDRDVNFAILRLNKPENEQDKINIFGNGIDQLDEQEQAIRNDNRIPVNQKEQLLEGLARVRQFAADEPEEFIKRVIREDIINNTIQPTATAVSGIDVVSKIADQYSLEEFKQNRRIALKRIGSGEGGSSFDEDPGRSFNTLVAPTKKEAENRIDKLSKGTDEEKAQANEMQHFLNITEEEFLDSLNFKNLGISKEIYDNIEKRRKELKTELTTIPIRGDISFSGPGDPIPDIHKINRKLKEEFGDNIERYNSVQDQLDKFIGEGKGYSDSVISITETSDINNIDKRFKLRDSSDWVSNDPGIDQEFISDNWDKFTVGKVVIDGST